MQRRNVSAALAGSFLPVGLTACSLTPGTARSSAPLRALSAEDFRRSGVRGMGGGTLRNGPRSIADLREARRLGADHLRLFIEPQRNADHSRYFLPASQWVALERSLSDMEAQGLRLMLVAGFGDDARGGIWRDERLQDAVVRFWRETAERLRSRAVVAGFDIVNEPVPDGLTYGIRQSRWLELAARVVREVQSVDRARVLVLQSAPDATPESFSRMRPLPFGNLVYSVHSYEPFSFTHQGVMPDYSDPQPYPHMLDDGRDTAELLRDSLQTVQRFAERYDVPVYVGEFSAARTAPNQSVSRYLADSISEFLRLGWSWSYHEFRAWHAWDVEIGSSAAESRERSPDTYALQAVRSGLNAGRGRGVGD